MQSALKMFHLLQRTSLWIYQNVIKVQHDVSKFFVVMNGIGRFITVLIALRYLFMSKLKFLSVNDIDERITFMRIEQAIV
ncbi:hypothetical protein A1OK_15110 [Enterovibrio norvegicus FF-454]|uniref:Uncharacterized protein n=1 Tax=Enterovibrio norvegicus FF-454 TaxID=1185651 RepID=A0A1E5BZB1_9GAMM|nr:hypothetical protein A1OK_15110 [Enterovibrio norvegicus FF-454]